MVFFLRDDNQPVGFIKPAQPKFPFVQATKQTIYRADVFLG